MKRVAVAVLLLALLGTSSCGKRDERGALPAARSIYGAVLEYLHTKLLPEDGVPQASVQLFVVQSESTISGSDARDWKARWAYLREHELGSLRADTCAAFVAANAKRRSLEGQIHYTTPIQWVGDDELERGTDDWTQEWQAFYERHPGAQGILKLSLPGVSSDGDQALVYVRNARGELDGWCGYCLLRRSAAGWKAVGWTMTLIS